VLNDDLHGAPDICTRHTVSPHEFRLAVLTSQIDLNLTIAEYMDMCGFVIIDEDDDTQSILAVDRHHFLK